MKTGLLLCVLCAWVAGARTAVISELAVPQADMPQNDQAMAVLRIVENLSRDLQETADQRDSWLTRYQQVADVIKTNAELTKELKDISELAMPVIWNTFSGANMMNALGELGKGSVGSPWFTPPSQLPPQQPEFLFIYPTNLTIDDKFTVQAVVIPTTEANVGFSVYYEPPAGEPVDAEHGDVFFSFHLDWAKKEITLNDRYNGAWTDPSVTVSGNLWPNVEAGERFIISVTKLGPCISTIIILGDDMHMQMPFEMMPLIFCPKVPHTGDSRKLWLTVREDKQEAKEVVLQWVTWFPTY